MRRRRSWRTETVLDLASYAHQADRGEGLLGQNLLGAVFHEPYARRLPLAPYEAQLALSAVLVAASLMLGRLTRPERIAGLLLAAVMLNPRAMRYDLSMAAIPLLAVAASLFQRSPPSATVQAVWAVVLATVMTLANQNNASFDGYLYPAIAVLALLGAAASGFGRAENSGMAERRG